MFTDGHLSFCGRTVGKLTVNLMKKSETKTDLLKVKGLKHNN